MTDLRKAAEMALEAFEMLDRRGGLGLDVHEYIRTKIEALRQALAQPEQKYATKVLADGTFVTEPLPLYTAPPKREWVGLTDEEVDEIYMHEGHEDVVLLTQAKLKEKNGG